MLSTLSEYSMRYPVRNSSPFSGPRHTRTATLKTRARPTQNPTHRTASPTSMV